MITVSELKKCKKASDELIETIKQYLKEKFPDEYDCPAMEDNFELEIDGMAYSILEKNESEWTDEGKYSCADKTYQLVSYDKNKSNYICDENMIAKYDLFINQSFSRSGSYFSDYNYQYNSPTVQVAVIERIPEKVIKAHDEVRFISK